MSQRRHPHRHPFRASLSLGVALVACLLVGLAGSALAQQGSSAARTQLPMAEAPTMPASLAPAPGTATPQARAAEAAPVLASPAPVPGLASPQGQPAGAPPVPAVMTSGDSAPDGGTSPLDTGANAGALPGSAPPPAPAAVQTVAAQAGPTANPPQFLFQEPPTQVRVAVLNATGKTGGANKVALLLREYRRRNLEDRIGLRVEMVNVSKADVASAGRTVIYYRAEFLRAALIMAEELPGDQVVAPMRPAELKRAGVDVEIVVGAETP